MTKPTLVPRRGETVLESFERRIGNIERAASSLYLQAHEVESLVAEADAATREAEALLAFLAAPRPTLAVVCGEAGVQ